MVTTAPPAEGGGVCEGAGCPPGREVGVGVPAAGGRRRAARVLGSVHPPWLFGVQHAVKGHVVFIPFFHSVYFFPRDPMNVSSTEKKANV